VRGVDWGFNAYGKLYTPYDKDELVARKVLEIEGARRYRAPLVMEGGSFHVDGEGTCLVRMEGFLVWGGGGKGDDRAEQSRAEQSRGQQAPLLVARFFCFHASRLG
jgi:agmatine/peptidylarginine deiminase